MENLLIGMMTALTPTNLLYAFSGVFIGNIIGVLPGIGAMAAISMLLPLTYHFDPTGSVIMLAGMYYGTSFGGAITSILLNLPGTPSHAIVCLDGHAMAQSGRGGVAIFTAMVSSAIGVSVAVISMTILSPYIVQIALSFGPAEYFALILFGLLAASTVSTTSPLRGIAGVFVGLVIGAIGIDPNEGTERFTFGSLDLADGISIVALAMGLFGVRDVLNTAGSKMPRVGGTAGIGSLRSMLPSKDDVRQSSKAVARGSIIGTFFGALPGTGATISSFMSYIVEKRSAKFPERFGKGAIEGVAGPEAANSSAEIAAFIPTLTLGIPGSATMALILGALMIHNITPGPLMLVEHADVFWGLVMSFWVGNILLVLMNMPLVNIWIKLLSVPYKWIFPVVLLLIAVGVYSVNNNVFDVAIVLLIGAGSSALAHYGVEPAPIILGVVLGPLLEENFRRALILSDGDLSTFVDGYVNIGIWAVMFAACVWNIVKYMRKRKEFG